LLYAVALRQLDLVRYIVENIKINTAICLKEPLYSSEDEGKDEGETSKGKFWNSGIALMIAVNNHDMEMLDYLWNKLYYLWELSDLDRVIDSLYQTECLDALPIILKGRAFHSIILALPFED
jgi:hypothetical protein